MLFDSLSYLLAFFPVVCLAVFTAPTRWRWVILLIASLGFYACLKAPHLLLALGFSTLLSYRMGLAIGREPREERQRVYLWVGILGNVLLLIGLKYLPFIANNLRFLAGAEPVAGWNLSSIGVSFFVFQAISYLADVYLGLADPEANLGHFALHMAFFPKLLQGPIERAGDLLPQLKQPVRFKYAHARDGLFLMGWGLFKKLVLADRLGLYVDPVYDHAQAGTSGVTFLLATYAFAFQLYFDFSGYTDMALGAARVFGIQLTSNFNSPYLATSVADFWRRWHITFSRWVLDYLFKPLQMHWRQWRNAGVALALLITFAISGLWHGAGWGYIIWGVLQGAFLAMGIFWKPLQKKLHKACRLEKTWVLKAWQVVATFHLVCLSWIFFRARSLPDAMHILRSLLSRDQPRNLTAFLASHGKDNLAILVLGFSVVCLVSWLKHRRPTPPDLAAYPSFVRWGLAYLLLFGLLALRASGGQFIYLQF